MMPGHGEWCKATIRSNVVMSSPNMSHPSFIPVSVNNWGTLKLEVIMTDRNIIMTANPKYNCKNLLNAMA